MTSPPVPQNNTTMNKAQIIAAIEALGFAAIKIDKQAKVEDLQALLDKLQTTGDNAAFTASVDATVRSLVEETEQELEATKKALAEANDALTATEATATELEATRGTIAELEAQIEELTAALEKAESSAPAAPKGLVVEVDGEKYEVISGGNIKVGETYKVHTKEEIAADAELVATLAKKGSGLLKKVEGK